MRCGLAQESTANGVIVDYIDANKEAPASAAAYLGSATPWFRRGTNGVLHQAVGETATGGGLSGTSTLRCIEGMLPLTRTQEATAPGQKKENQKDRHPKN